MPFDSLESPWTDRSPAQERAVADILRAWHPLPNEARHTWPPPPQAPLWLLRGLRRLAAVPSPRRRRS
jgi:hypothetical protein